MLVKLFPDRFGGCDDSLGLVARLYLSANLRMDSCSFVRVPSVKLVIMSLGLSLMPDRMECSRSREFKFTFMTLRGN